MSSTRPDIDIHPKTLPAAELKQSDYDVVVIGGGPAGLTAAFRTSMGGLRTLIVEAELVGGECSNWACIPSKALLRPSEVVSDAAAIGGARERLEVLNKKCGGENGTQVDVEGVWARRDMFTHGWKDDFMVGMLQGAGVDVAHGFAQFSGPKKVQIKDWHSENVVKVEAKHAVIVATGSVPRVPQIAGLKEVGYWTPREAVSAREVPKHLIVLGAGAVGMEMATFYKQIGSEVTLVAHRILPKVVPEAGKIVQDSLTAGGVDIRLGQEVKTFQHKDDGVEAVLSDGSVVHGTKILVAAGRVAATAGMMLEEVGRLADGQYLAVDDSMCVRAVGDGWLYAIGDVNGRAALTHVGKYQGKLAGNAIVARANGRYDQEAAKPWDKVTAKPVGLAIAQAVFTEPQVAACGLTPKQASDRGIKFKTVAVKSSGPGVMLHADGNQIWAQWVVDDAGKLIGATFVGRDAVDLLQASTMGIVGNMTVDQIWHVTPPFPTISEVYTDLSEAVERGDWE